MKSPIVAPYLQANHLPGHVSCLSLYVKMVIFIAEAASIDGYKKKVKTDKSGIALPNLPRDKLSIFLYDTDSDIKAI